MVAAVPHYLLFSDYDEGTARGGPLAPQRPAGAWRVVLERLSAAAGEAGASLRLSETEPGVTGERLELLAVVRGLEALDQPSCVTLLTRSRYVYRGFRYGLAHWRADGWRWERFGQWVRVPHADLWQRVDHALKYHQVRCLRWQAGEVAGGEVSRGTRMVWRRRRGRGAIGRTAGGLSADWGTAVAS